MRKTNNEGKGNSSTTSEVEEPPFQRTASSYELEANGFEHDYQLEDAIILHGHAASLYSTTDIESAKRCWERQAIILAQIGRYDESLDVLNHAFDGYQTIFEKALIKILKGDLAECKSWVESYSNNGSLLNTSTKEDVEFLIKLIPTIEEKNIDRFQNVIRAYDRLRHLDNWHTIMLLRVKNTL